MKIKADCDHGSEDGKAYSEYGEKGEVPLKRLWGLGGSYRSGRFDVSNCGAESNGLWQRLGGEGILLRQWAGRHQLWQVSPHFHYRGDPLEAQGGFVGEGEGEEPKIPEGLRQEIRGG